MPILPSKTNGIHWHFAWPHGPMAFQPSAVHVPSGLACSTASPACQMRKTPRNLMRRLFFLNTKGSMKNWSFSVQIRTIHLRFLDHLSNLNGINGINRTFSKTHMASYGIPPPTNRPRPSQREFRLLVPWAFSPPSARGNCRGNFVWKIDMKILLIVIVSNIS